MKKALLILLLACSSCVKVGPNFRPPCAPLQDSWQQQVGVEAPDEQWWENLHDPGLNLLVERALLQNLSLKEAAWRILQARYELGIAVGQFFPQLQQGEGTIESVRRSRNAPNTGLGDLDFTSYRLGLTVAWELDFWGRFRRGIEAAQDQVFATYANYDDVQVLLISEVASTYTALRTIQKRIAILEGNIKIQERSLDIVDARWQAGLVTELDVQQAKTLLESTRARLPQLLIDREAALNGLAVLLGVTPEEIPCYLSLEGDIPKSPDLVEAGLPCALVMRRPDLRRALNELAAQSALIGVAYSDLFPHVFIGGTIGVESSGGASFTRSGSGGSLLSAPSFTYILGPSFAWQIWNYGRLENRVRAEYAVFYRLVARYQNSVLAAYRDVENSLTAFIEAEQQEIVLKRSVEAAQRAADLANAQYVEGIQDYTRVLQTLEALLNAQEALVGSQGAVTQGYIASYRALGVGAPKN
ncbi:MAG: efflux transporter outer membrane subunit [Chlamydiia bacterium]|nr:efflux transporter outer membrane subunit [Chlamydiia bacterium]